MATATIQVSCPLCTFCECSTNVKWNGLAVNGRGYNYGNSDVWQDAPVLTGSTKFEPLSDVKSIMITGGAGFM